MDGNSCRASMAIFLEFFLSVCRHVVGPSVDTHLVFRVVLAVVAIVVGDGDGVLLLKKNPPKTQR